jgi:hypothetical protein
MKHKNYGYGASKFIVEALKYYIKNNEKINEDIIVNSHTTFLAYENNYKGIKAGKEYL